METNETRKGKYSTKKITKKKKPNKEQKIRKKKTYNNENRTNIYFKKGKNQGKKKRKQENTLTIRNFF